MSFDKYSSIDNLYKRPDIFALEEVVCTEKLHGCNFRVHYEADSLKPSFGSRNNEVKLGSGFYADRPVQWFLDRPLLLSAMQKAVYALPGNHAVTIYGEIIGARIQKGVTYLPDEEITFRAFDVKVGDTYLDHNAFVAFCNLAMLDRVPVLYIGKPLLSVFDRYLEIDSYEALDNGVRVEKNISEGIVIKSTKELRDVHDNRMMAKHKSQGFAEATHTPRPTKDPRWTNPCLLVAETYVTRGRVLNAIEKAESHSLGHKVTDMSAMKYLPAFVFNDVLRDYENEPGETASDLDAKGLMSAITRQTGIVLKGILNERIGT